MGDGKMPLELPSMVASHTAFRAADYFTTNTILTCSICFLVFQWRVLSREAEWFSRMGARTTAEISDFQF
jgi:hypothetical protein